MTAFRSLVACLVLAAAPCAWAVDITIDPARYMNPNPPQFRVKATWPSSTTEDLNLFFVQPRFLRTTASGLLGFDLEQLGAGHTANLEYGILGADGQRTLFGTKTNEPIASQSHNVYLQLPSNTEIYGFYLRINPDLGVLTTSFVQFSASNVVVGPYSATGDYNIDGIVDAADYVVWRDSLNQAGLEVAADGNTNGKIDAGDFDVWKAEFGTVIPPTGAGASVSIPEPESSFLFVLAATGSLCCRRRYTANAADLRLAWCRSLARDSSTKINIAIELANHGCGDANRLGN